MSTAHTLRADTTIYDQQILQRMAHGEPGAVADLYDAYGRLVFSLIVRMVGDAALAEDLVQDVFVRVWHSAASYQPELGSVRTWLVAIAHHCAVDELRRRHQERGWISLDDIARDEFAAAEDHHGDPLIYRALQALPPEQRQVVQLAYFDGLTVLEIAEHLDLAPGTVKSRMRLAMNKLRAWLGVERDSIP